MKSHYPTKAIWAAMLAVTAAAVFLLDERRAVLGAGTAPILEINNDTLVTYKGGATPVADVRPVASQRGVGLDGGMRRTPGLPLALFGNPFEGSNSMSGIRDSLGTYEPLDIDIALPCDGPGWVIGRTYNNIQVDGSAHHVSDGSQGKNWFQVSQMELLLYEASAGDPDVLYLVYGADRFVEYRRVETSDIFVGTNGSTGVIVYDENDADPDTYTLTDQVGNEVVFWGSETSSISGQIWKISDPSGKESYVGHASNASSAHTAYNTDGTIVTAYDSSNRRYSYSYTTIAGVGRLTEVKVETKDSTSTWAIPTGLTEVARVEYSYYASDNDSHGDAGDLKRVVVLMALPDSGSTLDSGAVDKREQYYRYYDDVWSDSAGRRGEPHAIKFVLGPEGVRRYDYSDASFDDDHLVDDDADLEPYVALSFEYASASDYRIAKTWSNGDCGCSGGNNGAHEYEYSNVTYTDTAGYDSAIAYRTTIRRPSVPDGGASSNKDSWHVKYFDEAQQPLTWVTTSADPTTLPSPATGGTHGFWAARVVRDSMGCVTELASPAAASQYTYASGLVTLNSTVGLVTVIERLGSGAAKGFQQHTRWKEGASGTAYYLSTVSYETGNRLEFGSGPEACVVRPLLASRGHYAVAGTTSSGSIDTTYSFVVPTGELYVESMTTTYPAVSQSNNGSGSASTTSRFFNADGSLAFEKNESGVITHRAYDEYGRQTRVIHDANTGHADLSGVTIPPGFASSGSGSEFHRVTSFSYHGDGSLNVTTLPDGRRTKSYTTVLNDRRIVMLDYPAYETSPQTLYYGPVQCAVTNHAGIDENSGIILLSGGSSSVAIGSHILENEDDLIEAVGTFGEVAGLIVIEVDESGTRPMKSRSYFDLSGLSALPGTDGVHFDETLYEYDDLGRRVQVTDPTGTIRKTYYDIHGAMTEAWTGTNANPVSGNMTKVASYVYDAGAVGGNRRVTKVTKYVQDGAAGSAVTEYAYDVRGRKVLDTNPTSPHFLTKLDNLGRVIAVGQYSIAPASSADPTTTAGNRLALTEFVVDELGRACRTTVHEVVSGALGGSLVEDSWFDSSGRLVKFQGSEYMKFKYDRVGRQTHAYQLAADNDGTAYGNVLDVSGDTVVSESQRAFPAESDGALAQVFISRHHNDTSWTGGLDTNDDSDDMKWSTADIKGRIQIESMWYDNLGRLEDYVKYGTNGAQAFTRSGLSVPLRSDPGSLRQTFAYGDDGLVFDETFPSGSVRRLERDAAGRPTKCISNYVSPGTPADPAANATTLTSYEDALVESVTHDAVGSADQTTSYSYGTTKGTGAGQSRIATGHLLQEVTFPDSSGPGDVVKFEYDAQERTIYRRDQAGNELSYVYNSSGWQTSVTVDRLGAGFDGAIRQRSIDYDSMGRISDVRQRNGSSTVKDHVRYTYDGWGELSTFAQDADSEIAASGGVPTYSVDYAYASATSGRRTRRRTAVTYPGGSSVGLSYVGVIDGGLSRVSSVSRGATTVAEYDYNGLTHRVGTLRPEPNISWRVYDPFTFAYDRVDRFDRVTKVLWAKEVSPSNHIHFYDVEYTYDESYRVTVGVDNVHTGFDAHRSFDGLERPVSVVEGTWNGSVITSTARQQHWTWNTQGQMSNVKLDLNGDGLYSAPGEYNDTRTFGLDNALLTRDVNSIPPAEHMLSHDPAGNLMDDGSAYKYTYDPFYRVVRVRDQVGRIQANYRWNGLNRLVSEQTDTDGNGRVTGSDLWFHTAHDAAGRGIAKYRSTDSAPKEEYVFDLDGLDGSGSQLRLLICRDKDANTPWTSASDGTLEQRHYYAQNTPSGVAMVDSQGHILEWVNYSFYGVPFGLCGGDADSDGDCDALDIATIQGWVNNQTYDIRGDIDLNSVVNGTDVSLAIARFQGTTLGRGVLSASSVGNRIGFNGREHLPVGMTQATSGGMVDLELGYTLSTRTGDFNAASSVEQEEEPRRGTTGIYKPKKRVAPRRFRTEVVWNPNRRRFGPEFRTSDEESPAESAGCCCYPEWRKVDLDGEGELDNDLRTSVGAEGATNGIVYGDSQKRAFSQIKIRVNLKYEGNGGRLRDCTLQWFEWANRKVVGSGTVLHRGEGWQNQHVEHPKSQVFTGSNDQNAPCKRDRSWARRPKKCRKSGVKPYKLCIYDAPGESMTENVGNREVYIGFKITAGCPTRQPVYATFKQTINRVAERKALDRNASSFEGSSGRADFPANGTADPSQEVGNPEGW